MEGKKPHPKNRQVERTRGWIWDALMQLMETQPYEKIRVADITERAGIARQTFYYNYCDKDDVVFERLDHCVDIKIEDTADGRKQIAMLLNRAYLAANREIIQRFIGIPSVKDRMMLTILDAPLHLMDRGTVKASPEYEFARCKIGFQTAGVLRIIVDWFTRGMKMPVDRLAALLNDMCAESSPSSRAARYRNVPAVVVRVEEGG
jgi:AcrR family transcriptional regulator